MRRWHLVLAVAVAAAAVAVPVVIVRWLTDETLPAEAVAPVERDEVLWSAAFRSEAGYELQAGGMAGGVPAIMIQVPFGVDPDAHIGLEPVFSPPVGGRVVYVSDDGERSTVWRLSIDDRGEVEPLVGLADVVWDIAVAPDGSAAYLALARRDDGRDDRGVVRVSLDGSGDVEPIMDALPMRLGLLRPAAAVSSDVRLSISSDGRWLGRTTCIGAEGCRSELIDVETRDRRPSDLPVFEIGRDGIGLRERCEGAVCTAELYDSTDGEAIALRSEPADTTIRPVEFGQELVAIVPVDDRPAVVRIDMTTGEEDVLYRPPVRFLVSLADRTGRWAVPDGWVVIEQAAPGVPSRYLLLSVEGGEPIDLGPTPWRDPFGSIQG